MREPNEHQSDWTELRSYTMLENLGTYANKKRRKPVLKQKRVNEGNEVIKSNPSKRHRDRLNGELDRLTDLLPFPEEVRSGLDKLSVLRLSVGYLKVKSYLKASMKNNNSGLIIPGVKRQHEKISEATEFPEGNLLLKALNGFVLVVTSEGLVFYASATIKDYLGFQQSDVVHQSVFELIHTDDRAMFRQHLQFAANPLGTDLQGCVDAQMCSPDAPEEISRENSSFLERSFVCRFRSLLDNSSGFLALKFKGRLKYLHGQNVWKGNGTPNKPQLALFAIAMPVQPPLIVEIRSKVILFQTKHKLDFTPLAIDNRGKLALGYSEIDLCMRGSGYQFIHAADMMYCADNHIRMMKTGESGLTVFRLLCKSGAWLWVKANAKLIYKGGRPEYIVAYQRALAKAEGEEYLRQRRLQLPFSLTTGEAILYDTGPTVDIKQTQFCSKDSDMSKDVAPGSLLDSFLKQDKAAYTKMMETQLPLDEVFMDSKSLVSMLSHVWQDSGGAATDVDPFVMKEETRQCALPLIDRPEGMAQNGVFSATLQNLEVDGADLLKWENSLKKLSNESEKQRSSELDCILANDIFDYIDTVLFKDRKEDCLSASLSCLAAAQGNQQNHFSQATTPSPIQPCEQELSLTDILDRTSSQINNLYTHQQDTVNRQVNAERPVESHQAFCSTQKLSHFPTSHHQRHFLDIFSPSQELTVPGNSTHNASADFQSGQVRSNNVDSQGIPSQMQCSRFHLCPQNNTQAPAAAVNEPSLLSSGIPRDDLNSQNSPTSTPFSFLKACPQKHIPFGTSSHLLQDQFAIQNGQEPMPIYQSQARECQTSPLASFWSRNVNAQQLTQQGGMQCGQADGLNSCMFTQKFYSSPVRGTTPVLSGVSCQRSSMSLDQSPPQGFCYFQCGHREPVVGTSAVTQENIIISPLPLLPNISSSEWMEGSQMQSSKFFTPSAPDATM